MLDCYRGRFGKRGLEDSDVRAASRAFLGQHINIRRLRRRVLVSRRSGGRNNRPTRRTTCPTST